MTRTNIEGMFPAPRSARLTGEARVDPSVVREEFDSEIPDQGYRLVVAESTGVTITHSSDAGLRYA